MHVHSRRDPCVRCNLALSLFAFKVQAMIDSQLQNEGFKFIITVSSRSTYGDSRMFAGHDSRYNHPILLEMAVRSPDSPAITEEERLLGLIASRRTDLPPAPVPEAMVHQLLRVDFLPPTLPSPTSDDARETPDTRSFHTVFPDTPCLNESYQRLPG